MIGAGVFVRVHVAGCLRDLHGLLFPFHGAVLLDDFVVGLLDFVFLQLVRKGVGHLVLLRLCLNAFNDAFFCVFLDVSGH